MKYILSIASLALSSLTAAHAADAPFAMDCKSASGYYANVVARETRGGVRVIAAQHFAQEIGEALAGPGSDFASLSFAFAPGQCRKNPRDRSAIQCQGQVAVQVKTFRGDRPAPAPLIAQISFLSAPKDRDVYGVGLKLVTRINGRVVEAKSAYDFIASRKIDDCRF